MLLCYHMIAFSGCLLLASTLAAQTPPDVSMERSGFVAWLKKGPNSPLSAVAQQKVGEGLRLGPADADIPLPGIEEYRVYPDGAAASFSKAQTASVRSAAERRIGSGNTRCISPARSRARS